MKGLKLFWGSIKKWSKHGQIMRYWQGKTDPKLNTSKLSTKRTFPFLGPCHSGLCRCAEDQLRNLSIQVPASCFPRTRNKPLGRPGLLIVATSGSEHTVAGGHAVCVHAEARWVLRTVQLRCFLPSPPSWPLLLWLVIFLGNWEFTWPVSLSLWFPGLSCWLLSLLFSTERPGRREHMNVVWIVC